MAVETEIARQLSIRVKLGQTTIVRQAGYCVTPQAIVEAASAFTDGTNFIDDDGEEVGWIGWPTADGTIDQ